MMDVKAHYDALIDEGNDPVHDPVILKEHMDLWDGAPFVAALGLDGAKTALEIGVGTGRLARRTAPLCKKLYGIDISPKTIERARENLADLPNVRLICADFMTWESDLTFDVIYSSLTFMHIRDKQECINKVRSLLAPGGRFVLSIDKNRDTYMDFGDRVITIYPDDPGRTKAFIAASGLTLTEVTEVKFAHIFTAVNA